MKNFEVVGLLTYLNSDDAKKMQFTETSHYFTNKRNISKLEEYVKTLQDAEKQYKTPSEKFVEYETKKMELVKPFFKKDEQGVEVKNAQGNPLLVEGCEKEVTEIIIKLNEEYKETLEDRTSSLIKWEEFYASETDSDFSIKKLPASALKQSFVDSLTKGQFDSIEPMLEDDSASN